VIETELLHYGYLFILAGTIAEGDATLLTAAFLAHRGCFRLSLVLFVTRFTTLVASHANYESAHRSGENWLEERSDPRLKRIVRWSGTHGGLLPIASRFMIAFRTLVPVVCGATGMSPRRFLLWNAVGAAIWAAAFGYMGCLGGHVLSLLLDDLRRHEFAIAIGVATLVGGLVLWRTHGRELFDAWSLRRSALPR
jgi:membrane protein DedA with SNARE-associated domain